MRAGLRAILGILACSLCACALPPERIPNAEPPQRVASALERPFPVLQAGDLLTFNLKMDVTDGRVLFEKDQYDESSFPVVVEIEGTEYSGRVSELGDSAGVLEKKSIVVELDDGQEWQGQSRLALGAMSTDSTLMRERLSWETIHALGMVAPEVRYRRIEVNGKYIGLFLHTESIRPAMFERYGLGSDGQLFVPDVDSYCGDFSSTDPDRIRDCWIKVSAQDDDFQPLVDLSKAIADTPVAEFDRFLERQFFADSVIDWILINTLASNGNTYNKNYYLYRPANDERWLVVPYDYDFSFGRNFDSFVAYPQNIYNDHFVYYYPPELGASNPLKAKVLRNSSLRERLKERLRHVLGVEQTQSDAQTFGFWHPQVMRTRIEELAEVMQPHAISELYRDIPAERYAQDKDAVLYYSRARWHYLVEKLFGKFPWKPQSAAAAEDTGEPSPPASLPDNLHLINSTWSAADGDELAMMAEGYGYVLALLDNIRPGDATRLDFFVDVDMARAPEHVPPGIDSRRCVQRTWQMTLKTPMTGVMADLTIEYLQENSRRNELGESMDENALELWLYRSGQWRELPVRHNALANSLQTADLDIRDGERLRLVACNPEAPAGEVE